MRNVKCEMWNLKAKMKILNKDIQDIQDFKAFILWILSILLNKFLNS